MKRIFLLAFALLAFWTINAQTVPQGINYQTIVRGTNNDPSPGATVTLRFEVKDGIGSLVYQEEQTETANDNGLVNLIIGQGTAQFGVFQAIDWSIGPRTLTVYLKNGVGGFDPLGTMQLMSVPFALYTAKSSEATTANNLADLGAQNGQVLKWNGSAWVPANDAIGGNGTVTQINTGTGLTGGPITTSGTIALTATGVVPGAYGGANKIPIVTVDAQGRVTNVVESTIDPGTVTIGEGTGIDVALNGLNNFTIINTGDTDANDDVLKTTQHDGDLVGTYNTLNLKAGVVGTTELENKAVTAAKIDDMGAVNGKVLKYNGSSWVPADDLTGANANNYAEGTGIDITGTAPNFTIVNTGDTDANDDVLKTTVHDGDLNGLYNNLQLKSDVVTSNEIAANAVNTSELADKAVTGIKLNNMAASNGQVLKFDGTNWGPGIDNGASYTAGTAISITGTTINNTGDTDANDDVLKSTAHDGDLSGVYNNLQIKTDAVTANEIAANAVNTSELADKAVTGVKLNNMAASNGQVLKFDGTNWAPGIDNGASYTAGTAISINGTTINNTGDTDPLNDLTNTSIAAGDVTGLFSNLQIAASVVGTNELAPGAVTAPKLSQMGATDNQVLRWNGTAWAPATFAYSTCGRVNSPDGQERIVVTNQNICPGAAQFEVNTTLAEGLDVQVAGAGDVKGARVEATGGSGSNDGIILFSRSDNNEASGINIATGRNNNTTNAVGVIVQSGLSANNMDDVDYDFDDGNGIDQNYGLHVIAADNGSNNNQYPFNRARNLDMGIYASASGADWAAYFDGDMYAFNAYVEDDLHILNYANSDNINADWRLDVVDSGNNAFGLSFYYNGGLKAYIDNSGGGHWSLSDASSKENILPLPSVLSKAKQLNPVSYNFIDDQTKAVNWGFVSQDVEKLFPEMAKRMTLEDNSSITFLNYAGLSVVAIKAIQEQQQIIETQQAKLEKQEERLSTLEKEMAEMKAMLKALVIEKSGKK